MDLRNPLDHDSTRQPGSLDEELPTREKRGTAQLCVTICSVPYHAGPHRWCFPGQGSSVSPEGLFSAVSSLLKLSPAASLSTDEIISHFTGKTGDLFNSPNQVHKSIGSCPSCSLSLTLLPALGPSSMSSSPCSGSDL